MVGLSNIIGEQELEINTLKQELNRLKEENEKMREVLKEAKPLMKGHFFEEDVDEWLVKYNELMGEERL